MKRFLIILALIVFLGTMPLELWKQGTPEEQQQFVQTIVRGYMKENNCQRVEYAIMTDGTSVLFFAECLDEKIVI